MPRIGGWEWVIVLVIVLLIFGVGRLSKVGRELGEGIREFREGLTGGEGGDGENQEEAENTFCRTVAVSKNANYVVAWVIL